VGLGGITEQGLHLRGPEVAGINAHHGVAGIGAAAGFVDARALPENGRAAGLAGPAELGGGQLNETAHRFLAAGGDHEVFRALLLEHAPLHLDVVAGMAPVAEGIEVAHVEAGVEACIDAGQAAGDLAGDEGFTAPGALVIEEDAVAGIHAVGLAVVDGDPVGVELGDAVGTAGIEGGGFLLGDFLDEAVELGGGGLVNAGFVGEPEDADGLENAEGAEGVGIGGVFGRLEAHLHMALGTEVVDLIGLHLLDDADQVAAVGEIAVVEDEPWGVASGGALVGILVEVIDACGVEAAGAALDAMHHIVLLEQQLGQVGAVLAGDAGDDCGFGHRRLFGCFACYSLTLACLE